MTVQTNIDKLITVFGGSGFLGRHLVRALAKRHCRIRVAVRRPDLAGHLQPLGRVGQIHAVQANVRYTRSVEAAAPAPPAPARALHRPASPSRDRSSRPCSAVRPRLRPSDARPRRGNREKLHQDSTVQADLASSVLSSFPPPQRAASALAVLRSGRSPASRSRRLPARQRQSRPHPEYR